MNDFTLVRVSATVDGAFGVLLKGSNIVLCTIEHTYISPDSPNADQVKIPAGIYLCKRRMFFRGGYETFEILVPGHSDILIHKANFSRDVDGCVGVGLSFHDFGSEYGIADSSAAFSIFSQLTKDLQSFYLRVVDVVSTVLGG